MEGYAPVGTYLWDCWFINRGEQIHLFHLQAPVSVDPNTRSRSSVSIGHAVSTNYHTWRELPTALRPGRAGEWDAAGLWSGSVAEKDGRYYLYYTGKSDVPGEEDLQQIGLATSSDLYVWDKHPRNPIVACDPDYYEFQGGWNTLGNIGAWRDPFVFKDPRSEKRYMTISARVAGSSREYNGCVALAESADMVNWKVLPPIFAPGRYDEIEVTRMVYHRGVYYLFFTTHAAGYEPSFAATSGAHEGLHCYYSKDLFGGYQPVNGNGVVLGNGEAVYDIRVLHMIGDEFIGIGWQNHDAQGAFVGKLATPVRLHISGDTVRVLL